LAELSLVVPVYGVQAYLRECLDSILYQSFREIEVIAVDDASPDHSGQILDEYAARDPRVVVIHLERNGGLGAARDVGLARASADYVWFVDSDDSLTPGTLERVVDRISATRPDVLLLDYARSYWWGKVERNIVNHLYREPPPPEVFTLAERPSALQILMVAWNRVFRREFLLGLDQPFGHGYYEDLAVTYPALMLAERITLLDWVGYLYRQRRVGNITRTANTRHFEVFEQYERVFAFMAAHPQTLQFAEVMGARTLWHEEVILMRNRVPRESRRAYYIRMADHYRRFHPAGGHPDRLAGRLLDRDAYAVFAGVTSLRLNAVKVRKRAGLARRQAGRVRRRAAREWARVVYARARRAPIDPNLAVFAAYWYRGYRCNPAAIYEKMAELAPHVHGVWVVRDDVPPESLPEGLDVVVPDTQRYFEVLARAKYFVNNVNFPDPVVKRPGQVHLETQHGVPLKKMYLDLQAHPVGANNMDFTALIERCDRWDYNVSSNRFSSEVWERCIPGQYTMLETGYPRNDRLALATAADTVAARAEVGVDPARKTVLYCPTFRDWQRGFHPSFDLARLCHELGEDYVILLRAHYYYREVPRLEELAAAGRLIDVSAHSNVETLYLASDVLLTDYSSAMFDYSVLDRPIVIYADDWETYTEVRGVTFDLLANPPGTVARSEDALSDAVRSADNADAVARRAAFRAAYNPWDDGGAAERVVRAVFL